MIEKTKIALLTFLTFAITANSASASTGSLGGMFTTVQTSFTGIGNLLLGGAFLGGIGLCGAGLMKLKAAADNQGRDPHYSEGIIRLAVGGALCALPAVTAVMTGTMGVGSGSW